MDWQRMSGSQKEQAQRWLMALQQDGVVTSVSQVAKFYDAVQDWDSGVITLATLLDQTRWETTALVDRIHRADLPTGVLRHIRTVLAGEGSEASAEALKLLPETGV